jgi:DNA-binding transcriptional MocR family regulator
MARRGSVNEIAAIARRALEAGVAVQILSTFAVGRSARAGLVLGYCAIATDEMKEGLRRLRGCFKA